MICPGLSFAYFINRNAAKAIISFNYPVKTIADNFVLFKIYCNIRIMGVNPFILDQDKKNFETSINLDPEVKKRFLKKRLIYKIKNKILKKFGILRGHKC